MKYIYIVIAVLGIGMMATVYVLLPHIRGAWVAFGPGNDSVITALEEQKNLSTESLVTTTNTTTDASKDISTDTIYGGLTIPRGFVIEVYAKDLTNPRDLEYTPRSGKLIVSEPQAGIITLLQDENSDGSAENHRVLLSGLDRPHGVAFYCPTDDNCSLYVGLQGEIVQYEYDPFIDQVGSSTVIAQVPNGGRHWRKQLLIGPYKDSYKLFVKVGSSCDVCEEVDQRRGTVMMMNLDGTEQQVFATGLRNAPFMALHPVTGEVWATEMGRDFLGDDVPPDEINILTEAGQYGWPLCYGANVHDRIFDKRQYIQDPCSDSIPAYIELPAHSAPLGIDFIPEEGWPEQWWYDAVVALHGSWNSTVPQGYSVVRLQLDAQGMYSGSDVLISGWLQDGVAIG